MCSATSMNKYLLAALVVALAILAGWWHMNQKPSGQVAPINPVEYPNEIDSAAQEIEPEDDSAQSITEDTSFATNGSKTYVNDKYAYTFKYPANWILESEQQVVSGNNK